MEVLSLFDGMSNGQLALNRAGVNITKYYASEVDKHAIAETMANFPNTIQLGDVRKVKVRLLCLLDVYSYIYNYDSDLQSNIREWEVLYWIDKNFTFSAKVGTQKSNERQKVSESSTIQRIEEIWFSNCEMGSVRKHRHNTEGRTNRERNDIEFSKQLQCSGWGYDNDIYRRYKEENIGITNRDTENRDSETQNIEHIKKEIFKKEKQKNCFGENQKSNVEGRCKKKLLRGEKEDRFSRKVEKENGNGGKEKNCSIDEVIRELCRWDEIDGIAQDYWNILQLHKEEQVTVVEYEGGFHMFKGVIKLLCGGSPCQSFSFSGKGEGMITSTNEEILTLGRYIQLKNENFEFKGQSYLFWEYVRILRDLRVNNPNIKFLLENVVMSKKWESVITETLGVECIKINSALVSPQNRVRLYWSNIPNVTQPEDTGICLVDILENDEIINPAAIRGRMINKATIVGRRLNERGVRDDYNKNVPITQCLEVRATNRDKSNCLTTVGKDNVLTSLEPGRYPNAFNGEYPFRYYTLKEWCRLQTVPDDYFKVSSENQAKKMLGNGWNVNTIAHIFKNLNQ